MRTSPTRASRSSTRTAVTAVATLLVIFGTAAAPGALAASSPETRLEKAKDAYRELDRMPDGGIPDRLVENCRCVIVIPNVVEGALVFGGRHGRGVASCRNEAQAWSPPSFVNISGGSWGLQIGFKKTDLVLFVMNEQGARSLLESEFTLGADAGVAAGPVGRSAEGSTDLKLDAAIYSYARSKGLFAGISFNGARMNSADKAIEQFYGAAIHPKKILLEHDVPKTPGAATSFLAVLP